MTQFKNLEGKLEGVNVNNLLVMIAKDDRTMVAGFVRELNLFYVRLGIQNSIEVDDLHRGFAAFPHGRYSLEDFSKYCVVDLKQLEQIGK